MTEVAMGHMIESNPGSTDWQLIPDN
jgi:hypothetical protein